jgi:hypothetical protein
MTEACRWAEVQIDTQTHTLANSPTRLLFPVAICADGGCPEAHVEDLPFPVMSLERGSAFGWCEGSV